MHELSFATQILEHIEREARQRRARRVSRVKLRVGALSGVNKDSLSFCLEAISANTLMEGAGIEIVETGVEVICQRCGSLPADDLTTTVCPICAGPAEASLPTDVCIEEIEVYGEEDQA